MKTLLIRNGRLIDPSQKIDRAADLFVKEGRVDAILAPGAEPPGKPDEEIDANGMIVAPGFVDLHVHFRDPGQTEKEDLESGGRSAVAGGFTSVLCMPNTRPTNDSPKITREMLERAQEVSCCRVYPVGAVTKGLLGKELSPMRELAAAGCVAFSDDGRPINDPSLLRQAFEALKELDLPLLAHCEELSLSSGPTIHEGDVAKRLGLEGMPIAAETRDVARQATLAAQTGCRLHLTHLSCKESVEILAGFQKACTTLSAEVTPHHLILTDQAVERFGTDAKMYPPLRREEDCVALQEALINGTVDAVATDHAPHTAEEKKRPYAQAPNGIIGLETALPVLLATFGKRISLTRLVEVLSTKPAQLVNIPAGSLKEGMPADIVLFSETEKWELGQKPFASKSQNSPFFGFEGVGCVYRTLVGGKTVYVRE